MKDKILTIDVGTGSTRAAIVRIDGAMIGFAQREYEQTTPRAGWSEQAPSLWWQAACDCIREVLYRYPETAAQIAVIGACGQMHATAVAGQVDRHQFDRIQMPGQRHEAGGIIQPAMQGQHARFAGAATAQRGDAAQRDIKLGVV